MDSVAPHFEISIDFYFDPLNFVELFQQLEEISELIHSHCCLLCPRGIAYLRSELSKIRHEFAEIDSFFTRFSA